MICPRCLMNDLNHREEIMGLPCISCRNGIADTQKIREMSSSDGVFWVLFELFLGSILLLVLVWLIT